MFSGADPFLLCHNGMYYIDCTTENGLKKGESDTGFYVHQSSDLTHRENQGLCLSKENVLGDKWFWAPVV